jgi:hypothetical protein
MTCVASPSAASEIESLTSTRKMVQMREVSTLRTSRPTHKASSSTNAERNSVESRRCCHGKSASDRNNTSRNTGSSSANPSARGSSS